MSFNYNQYLKTHLESVKKAFEWIKENIPEVFKNEDETKRVSIQIENHDASKFTFEEYEAYNDFFYGSAVPEPEVRQAFNEAWLHHIHTNPHHWQHWILINDDPELGEMLLKIPNNYLIEMICDWWSFSWAKGDLYLIFDWYEEHKAYMKINSVSKWKIEVILNKIKAKLDKEQHLTD